MLCVKPRLLGTSVHFLRAVTGARTIAWAGNAIWFPTFLEMVLFAANIGRLMHGYAAGR